MRVVRFHTFGDPSVLRVDDVAQPAPHDNDVLIWVSAASVNSADLGARQGHGGPILVRRLPMIPGYDLAGEVAACGRKVTAFLPGDRVFALVGLRAGTTAEYVAVSQAKVARAPQHISLVEARVPTITPSGVSTRRTPANSCRPEASSTTCHV